MTRACSSTVASTVAWPTRHLDSISVGRFRVDVVVSLNHPAVAAADQDFHQLRLDHAVGWDGDAGGHRFDAADLVVDVDNRNVRRHEADAPDLMLLGRPLVEARQDLAMTFDEG